MAEWAQQAHLLANHALPGVHGAVSALYFDTYMELLWTGSASGQVTSHTNAPPAYPRYTSFLAHGTSRAPEPVLGLTGNEKAIFSVASGGVHAAQRSGLGRWSVRAADHAPGLQLASMCGTPLSTSSEIFVGGATDSARTTGALTESDVLFAINTNAGTVVRTVASDAPLTHLRRAGRAVCAGTAGGAVQVRDPRSLAVEARLTAHHGGLTDMQADGHYVYTIGWTLRQGHPVTEPLLKVFDLRTLQPLVPIPLTAPGGPAYLAVHPKRNSLLAVATPQAHFQIVDMHMPGQSEFYINSSRAYTSAMAFSPAADTLVFGETDGSLRLWTNDTAALAAGTPVRFNAYSLPAPPAADVAEMPPAVHWAPDTPLSVVGMPQYDTPLLSASHAPRMWTERSPLFHLAPRVDPLVVRNARTRGGLTYAPLPPHLRGRRNELRAGDDVLARCDRTGRLRPGALAAIRGAHAGRRVDLNMFRSEQRAAAAAGEAPEPAAGAAAAAPLRGGMPSYYRQPTIEYSRFGVEDFDFSFYNKTAYSGLENNIAHAYANAYLEALHYCAPLDAFAAHHLRTPCAADACLLCEAGFLFRMLADARGANCHASNFLRTLALSPDAAALGLIDSSAPFAQLVQRLNHFFLSAASRAAAHTHPPAHNPAAWPAAARTLCAACGAATARPLTSHVIDLAYPRRRAPLAALVAAAMAEGAVLAWCDVCGAETPHSAVRQVDAAGLPDVFVLNACVSSVDHLAYWARTNFEALALSGVPYRLRTLVVQIQAAGDPPHLVTFARIGDKWFLFNDFLVREVDAHEALSFGDPWKIPAVLMYERTDDYAASRMAAANATFAAVPPDTALLTQDLNVAAHRDPTAIRHRPLTRDELPTPGTLVAIDAEFVSIEDEEMEVCSDGTRTLVHPGRLALARVSVLRGAGAAEGVPFIDDHIPASEPVVDYLTQFSGIHDGDLDPARSRYTLVPHKTAYKKLRMLVDMGCRFIGHGLAKDFRIINIFVPPEQVIDTVNLYHSPAHPRNLSLRFLAWFLLKEHIQESAAAGHDSIEDADAALKLYRCYLGFQRESRLEDVLEDLYEIGPRVQWRPPARA